MISASITADFEILTEADIPGASLDGKQPKQLNVTQLRRWLACRGAPVSGKKPQLIERFVYIVFKMNFTILCILRVECYIQYGWDQYLLDPDKGLNCRRKLIGIHKSDSEPHHLLNSLPLPDDEQWTKQLQDLPTITFNTIYDFLVDRKILMKKVSHLENAMETQGQLSNDENSCCDEKSWYESVEYTRTLDKAYRFFKDGHVQAIKYHPWSSQPDVICITSTVLPSMRKDRVYCVTVAIKESTCRVVTAYCTCPAGLSGCCNHVTSTLYCLEDFVRRGLREEERMGCTEKLQKWNQPRKRNVDPRPTDDVVLTKAEYGKQKRSKVLHVNKWDCRPDTRRIVDPNKARRLRESLSEIEKSKLNLADFAICTATTEKARKQALEKKSMISGYGTSCFLQILDEEPAPEISREEQIRKERLAKAEEQKQLFMQQLAAKQAAVQQDHDYGLISCDTTPSKPNEILIQRQADELYNQHVCVSPSIISEIEETTRGQHESQKWHHERRLRITASVMKEICHQRPSTSCIAFIKRKLSSTSVDVPAITYGRKSERQAISSYVYYQQSKGKFVQIESCGLYIDKEFPWLAASPDGIVTDLSRASHGKGCLEIKCPYVCEKQTVSDACRNISGFCLTVKDGRTELSKSHMYFYQVQTQLHVTGLLWCDFCVWSPVGEPFVQQIEYDKAFMDKALKKARKFYFNKFLPAITPYMIISSCGHSTLPQSNLTKQTPVDSQILTNLESNAKCNVIKSDPNVSVVMYSTSVQHVNRTQDSGTEKQVPLYQKAQKTKQPPDCDDVQFVAAYSKPSPVFQTFKSILLHLKLQKHPVRGDGNCLYHAIAHQAGLIPSSSSGDETVCRHLRHLTFLTMLNYPAIQSEGFFSQGEWMEKQQTILQDNEWGGDVEIRLMAIGLKKEVTVITDSVGDAFARKYPCQPPPVSKMKGGVFIPLSGDELCAQYNSLSCHNSLVLLYNGCNHFDSTKPL